MSQLGGKVRFVCYGLINAALGACGLVILGIGTWRVLTDSSASSSIQVGVGLVLIFAATIDRFESLKGLGIEAKTRELKASISQADEVLKQHRALVEAIAPTFVLIASKSGRYNSVTPPAELRELAQAFRAILRTVGSDEALAEKVLQPWVRVSMMDVAWPLVVKVRDPAHAYVQEQKKLIAAHQPGSPDDNEHSALKANCDKVSAFVDSCTALSALEPESLIKRMDEVAANLPDCINDQVRAEFKSDWNVWRPEFAYLAANRDMRSLGKWIHAIETRHRGG